MKEQFIKKNFNQASINLIYLINQIIADYQRDGYDLSLRQLYYQLVSRNVVENTEKSYKNVGSLVSDARLAGLIDWEIIKDRGRQTISNAHWDSPASILDMAAKAYRIDRWQNQPCYVEVMVEKQALEGVLIPVCREMDVSFTANKGYTSSSAMYEASKRYLHRLNQGKELYVLYLGDHDPSGVDMTRDVDDRLGLFLHVSSGLSNVEVKRLALNMDQIERYRPPPNPAKITDTRASDYIARFGNESWELDAIEARTLARMVKTAINKLIDKKAWELSGKEQEAGRAHLEQLSADFEKGKTK